MSTELSVLQEVVKLVSPKEISEYFIITKVDTETGESISNDYDLVAQGTRHSKEFAAFLKGILGQIPDYGPLS